MDLKTMLIVGVACALCSYKLSAEKADGVKYADNYFEYTVDEKGTPALKCIDKAAMLGDLYRFVNTKCWYDDLKWKLSGKKLTREDADALDFCIDVHLEMLDALGEIMLRDLFGASEYKKFVDVVPRTNQLNRVLAVGERKRLRAGFIDGKEPVAKAIHAWAEVYRKNRKSAYCEALLVLHGVFCASGDVRRRIVQPFNLQYLALDNNLRDGWKLNRFGGVFMARFQEMLEESDPDSRVFASWLKNAINGDGTHIGANWRNLQKQVQIYVDETREICSRIGCMRRSGIADSETKKYLNDATSKWGHLCEYATRKFDYLLYDFPCCMLSYRALGQLADCKGVLIDNEDEMKSVAADYTYALCGTELLKGIRTRYAASCYTEVIKFLKSELGGWFTQDAFREFANETRLYNITLSTNENGKQDNILEKWESKGNQKTKGE